MDRSRWPSTAPSDAVDTIGSNAGHALWTGIVLAEQAPAVAAALGTPEMVSGWGLRTFAAGQPGYNPIGYHTGSVWPHDTAIAAAGLRRYGFDDAADTLSSGLLVGCAAFPGVPAARAVLRLRPGGDRVPDRLSGGLFAAGLGGRRRR